jgi:hypothetical protein
MAWVIKGIKQKKMNLKWVRLYLLNALDKEGRLHVREYKKTTSSWKGAKPRFNFTKSLAGGNAQVLSGVEGGGKGAWKWHWLDQGTAIRWALMSKDWKSKTRPGYFGSGSGAGMVLLKGRGEMMRFGHMMPRPGIKAREWTQTLGKRRKRPFQRAVIIAVGRGILRMYE